MDYSAIRVGPYPVIPLSTNRLQLIYTPRSLREWPSGLIFSARKTRGRAGGPSTCANAGHRTARTGKRARNFKPEGRFGSERGVQNLGRPGRPRMRARKAPLQFALPFPRRRPARSIASADENRCRGCVVEPRRLDEIERLERNARQQPSVPRIRRSPHERDHRIRRGSEGPGATPRLG